MSQSEWTRPGRSTISHILALRCLIERVKSHNLKAIIMFVEFKKAFDSINREIMFRIRKIVVYITLLITQMI